MTSLDVSCSRTQKSGRPLGATAIAIREAVMNLTELYDRMTVRGAYYQLVGPGVVAKTEGGYRQVQKQVLAMRRAGLLDWSFITDGTRWQRKPRSWDRVEDAMDHMANTYRRHLWQDQDVRIEVWLEKDALADVITDVTTRWDVPLMVSRGQSSATFLWNAAQAAREAWEYDLVSTVIYALYDRDAGGRRAARGVENGLREFAPDVPISFELLSVTDEQVHAWNLPTRPAKKSDPEAAKFEGDAVELDAVPPDKLIGLVEDAIVAHIDPHAWEVQQAIEAEEKAGLLALLKGRS